MKVYFIRHGATKGNQEHRYVGRTDEEILMSEWEKLRKLGAKIGRVNHVFTSPYLRCIQSAKALFGAMDVNAEQDHEIEGRFEMVSDFREMDFGAFEYKNYQELNGDPDYQRFIDSGGTIAFPEGEELEAFKARCKQAFEACMKQAHDRKWEKVAFVVHGGTIMAILETYGLPKQGYFDYQVKNGEGFTGEVIQGKYIQCQRLPK